MNFAGNVIVTFIARLLQVLLRLLGGIVVARVLGPAGLGFYALIQMVASVAVTLGNLGVNGSIVFYAGRRKDKINQLASNALLLGLSQGTALILFIVAGLFFVQFVIKSMQDLNWLLWLVMLSSIPFQLLILNFNALLQGQNKIWLFNKNSLIIAVINLLLIVILLLPLDMGLEGRVLSYTLGSVLGAAAAFWAVRDLYRSLPRPDWPLARDMLGFGSIINAITIIQFLNYRLDIFLLGYFCTTAEVGQYFVAVTLGEMLWYLPNAVGIVLFPILAGGLQKNSSLTTASARNNLLFIALMSAVVFVGAEFIVKVFFSTAYLPAVQPLRMLLPGIIGFSLAKIISPDLINRGLARVIAGIAVVCLILNVVLNLLLIPAHGATGAAIASSISYLAGVVVLMVIFCKVTGSSLREILLVNRQDLRGYLNFGKEIWHKVKPAVQRLNTYALTKRCLDMVFALFLLIFLTPVMLAIAAVIIVDSGRPVLFVQERAGLRSKSFKIYKFRTMREGIPSQAGDELRITRLGRLLRAASLDELPQLFNVLKGDMSLVGPRPTLLYQVAKYSPRQRERLGVLPGITGWAQVNQGQRYSWSDRIEMDLWYIQNRSVLLDLKILLRTLGVVLKGRETWVKHDQDSIASMPGDEKHITTGVSQLKKLVVIGAGGFGREVLQLALHMNRVKPEWQILGFVDDNETLEGKTINGFPVLGNLDWLTANAGDKFAVFALGEPELKRKVEARLQGSGIRYATLIHPFTVIGDGIDIGEGTIIVAGVVLTVDIKIGRHVIINANSCAGHDAVVGDYSTVAACVNIMGEVTIGDGCYVASGVTIRDGASIGRNTIIGLGAVVVGDLPADIVALGCPAKVIRENMTGKVFK